MSNRRNRRHRPGVELRRFDKLLPGEYTVCEGNVEGWLPTIALCQPITVVSEQTASVTFGNVQGGRIIVDKVTGPADAPDKFDFSLTQGEITVASFALSGADTPFDSGLLLPGAYTIEAAAAGWDLTDVTCRRDQPTAGKTAAEPDFHFPCRPARRSCAHSPTRSSRPPRSMAADRYQGRELGRCRRTRCRPLRFVLLARPSQAETSKACQSVGHGGGSLT